MAQTNKEKAALAALNYIDAKMDVIGVGTGSTVNYFIDALSDSEHKNIDTVASSEATAERLKNNGISVISLNSAGTIPVYIDGADELNADLQLIKGGGGALTREKIIAAASKRFVCIVDDSKQQDILGTFPLPFEVIPMARSYVAREIVKLGGQPIWREHFTTDNGNHIIDVHNLQIAEPIKMETALNQIAGIVTVGLFAIRSADIALVANANGVTTLTR